MVLNLNMDRGSATWIYLRAENQNIIQIRDVRNQEILI